MLEHLVPTSRPEPLVPRRPHIRSSLAKYTDPYLFLLRAKFGIVPASEYSEALALGSHFHKLLELEDNPYRDDRWFAYQQETLQAAGSGSVMTRVNNDLELAQQLWDHVIRHEPTGTDGKTIAQYLTLPHLKTLACELVIRRGLPDGNVITVQLDRLLFDSNSKTLRIFDLKSTSQTVQLRAAQCPFEFQTALYLDTVQHALPMLVDMFELPADTQLEAMEHLIFRKPTIRPSGEDRNYELTKKVISRGPRKGEVEMIREYYGDPVWSNYVERARQWYQSNQGEVLRSRTYFKGNSGLWNDFQLRLKSLLDLVNLPPEPALHYRTEVGATDWKDVSPYYPFFLSPDVSVWPQIMVQRNFRVEHRDEPIELESGEIRVEQT